MDYYIFGDVETTGLSSANDKDRMTEIALVKTDIDFNIIDQFQTLINPEREITEKITQLTGITEEMVSTAPIYDVIYSDIENFIKEGFNEDDNPILVAHNAPFDFGFINEGAKTILGYPLFNDFIDTVSLARELYPFWRNHKLDTCAKKLNVMNENHHRAMNDTMVLYQIAKKFIPEAVNIGINPVNFRTKKSLHYKKNNN